jgi:16S rRNA (cytosine1402-N4)-methyltransferase
MRPLPPAPMSARPRRERGRPRPSAGGTLPSAPPAYASGYHTPVLVRETVDLLVTDPAGVYVDGTLGGGGHSAALLDALAPEGRVVGLDQDPEALAAARARLAEAGGPEGASRFTALRGNFADMAGLLASAGLDAVDGILLDLGVSSHQIDEAARGFAYSAEGPLDMRMDPSAPRSAADLINTLAEEDLANLIYTYGEEPRSRKVARAIVERRPLRTTAELAEAVRQAVPYKEEVKSLSRVFQGLRIAVNDELAVLERALIAALGLLKPGGRLAVIAYHSLEDRPVKHFLRYGNFENEPVHDFYGNLLTPWEPVTRKAVQPSEEEVAANPRARSARLRVAEKRDPEASGLGTAYTY